jgi:hypothetical protein
MRCTEVRLSVHCRFARTEASEPVALTKIEAIVGRCRLSVISTHAKGGSAPFKRPPDELHLQDLIAETVKRNLVTPESNQHADLAKDARNLIHPGRATRSGTTFSKAAAARQRH